MTIWESEIKELDKLYDSFKGYLPDIVKELEQLIKTQDANVVMLYSRRCLEVIITDLCEIELKRPRKTEPLKGIIDKLNSEEKVPSHIISSMLSLNSMSTYGTHPKDFDPQQVKPVLNNLAIIIRWYIKYKDFRITGKTSSELKGIELKAPPLQSGKIIAPKNKSVLLYSGLMVVSAVIILLVLNITGILHLNQDRGQKELEKTIAVLPFKNLSNDSTQASFCGGFMEEVLIRLQRVEEFKVRSRTSTNQYMTTMKTIKTIGEEMNVNYLIEGSIGKDENNLKVWIKLINAKTDEPVWSNDYTREISMNHIFSLQSEIAKEIASELKTALTAEEIIKIDKKPTQNLEAYNYYLLGNDYYQKGYAKQDFEIAANMYEKAVQSDPNFAQAWVRLSLSYLSLFWFYYDQNSDQIIKSKNAIDMAFKIDQNLPEVHLALGTYYYWGFLNYERALEEIRIAENILKNSSELIYMKASIYRRAGEWSLAKEYYLKAFELDPGSAKIVQDLAGTYYLLGDYEESESYFDKALLINPSFIEATYYKSLMYMKRNGNTSKARETILEPSHFNEFFSNPMVIELNYLLDIYDEKYQDALNFLSLHDFEIIELQRYYINLKSLLYARVYALMDMSDKASEYYESARISLESRILQDPEDSRSYSALGIAYAGLGLKDKAIEAGEKGVELMTIKKEAFRGVCRLEDMAKIYVMVGEYDNAMQLIKLLLSLPGPLSVKLLQLDPAWKPLWNLPEFKKIIINYS